MVVFKERWCMKEREREIYRTLAADIRGWEYTHKHTHTHT